MDIVKDNIFVMTCNDISIISQYCIDNWMDTISSAQR